VATGVRQSRYTHSRPERYACEVRREMNEMMERHGDRSPDELLHAERYTPEELSQLTGVGIDVIRRAAYDGELDATVIDTDIVEIPRASALAWLNARAEAISDVQ
jgi:anaerobic selenocysteine-containing dehydrogenase